MVLSSVTCDRCTAQADFDSVEEELAEGWLIVHHRDRELDFCDQLCLQTYDFEEEA